MIRIGDMMDSCLKKWRTAGAVVLAVLLLSSWLPAQTRTVSLKVVADEEFREDRHWRDRIRKVVERVSADFEPHFGIRFAILTIEPWISDGTLTSLDRMALGLDAQISRRNCDILIAFTGQINPAEQYYGFSLFREATVILLDSEESPPLSRTLKHELAHLFGAVHVDDQDSLMDILARGEGIDAVNTRIIRLYRDRPFDGCGFPAPRRHLAELESIYRGQLTTARRRIAERDQARRAAPALTRKEDAGAPGFWEEVYLFNLDDLHNLLAQIHLENRNYGDATAECRRALAVNPRNQHVRALEGIILRHRGKPAEAAALYREMLQRAPGDPRLFFNLGVALADQGDFDAALSAYTRALELKPNYAEACTNLGEIYLRRDRIGDAERVLLTAVSLNSRQAAAHANLAEVYFRRDLEQRSLYQLRTALNLNPELPGPYTILGNMAFRDGRLIEAEKEYRRALTLDPDYERAHYNLGKCRLAQGDPRVAENHFRRAIEASAFFPEPYAGLGYCLLLEGKWDEAAEEIRKAHRLGFDSPQTHLNLSFAYLQSGRLDDAVEEARKVLALDPTSADARVNLGIAYLQQDMPSESAGQFQAALTCDPRSKEAHAGLGRLYMRRGDLREALSSLLSAYEIDPEDGRICCLLAEVFLHRGDREHAREYLSKAESLGDVSLKSVILKLKSKLGGRRL